MTIADIQSKIQDIQVALSANPEPSTRKKLEQGLDIFQSLLLSEQKKSEAQNQPANELPSKAEMQEWASKEEKEAKWNEIREKLPAMARAYDETIKTVKAPAIELPDELINIELEDSKGNKQVKTFSKAQVRALTRKYFSNVHESWQGKDRKMGVGFKNLLAYMVAWQEFDGALPTLRDVLPDYDRYKKGYESSDAFKVAQELYDKIISLIQ